MIADRLQAARDQLLGLRPLPRSAPEYQRQERLVVALQYLDQILLRPDRAEAALLLALRASRAPQGPAEIERRLRQWIEAREDASLEHPIGPGERRGITAAQQLLGDPS